jgi:hypothetical protein
MEKDLENLSVFSGKTGGASVSSFKSAKYKNISFRYLDFSKPNLGICYTATQDFLVFTFSGEALLKTIDKIIE